MQRTLDRGKLLRDMLNSAYFLKNHELSTGKLGATGFCWGGGAANHLAVIMGDDLQAAAPFYGPAPKSEEVAEIRAALLVHYAEEDPRINAMRADFKAALEAAGVEFEMHTYPGDPPRIPQQLHPALLGGGRQACLGADDRLLRRASLLSERAWGAIATPVA